MSVHYEVRDRVGYMTLDRPDALNAIDEEALERMNDILTQAGADEGVSALVIVGGGATFSVGLDLHLLKRAFADPAYLRDVLERFKAVLIGIEALPVPVIAAVNGLARAGGFELMLACDMAIVAEDAKVGDTHLAYGIVPGGGATQRLPRLVGRQRAGDIIFSGRWMKGPEVAALGLALRAVPRSALMDTIESMVAPIRAMPRAAVAATKAAVVRGASLPLSEGLDAELDLFMTYLGSPGVSERLLGSL